MPAGKLVVHTPVHMEAMTKGLPNAGTNKLLLELAYAPSVVKLVAAEACGLSLPALAIKSPAPALIGSQDGCLLSTAFAAALEGGDM